MSFRNELGRFDTAMVVVGGIIGAGIFINPYIVAQRLDTPGLVLGAWLAGLRHRPSPIRRLRDHAGNRDIDIWLSQFDHAGTGTYAQLIDYVVSADWSNPVRSGIGFALLAAGVPAYAFWSGKYGGTTHG